MITELWRRVPGYPAYEVSTEGRVRRKTDKRLLKPRPDGGGYMQVALYKNKKRKDLLIHRLVLMAFEGLPNDEDEGNHRDGNKANNTWINLEWATPAQNNRHARQILGRGARIPETVKVQILALKAMGLKRHEIVSRTGALPRTVSSVVARAGR